jgi:pimeloyl-ACP methyl ester carboxylesterase
MHLPGIQNRVLETPRLRQSALFSGPEDGVPVLFVHGNVSSATFWEEAMLALPPGFRAVAPDLRGYGATEAQPVDGARGVEDWVDDLLALKAALGLGRYHVVGHSLGGVVALGVLARDAADLRSVTLVAPGSPYGFGGSRGPDGSPVWPDFAGSGGGTVNPEFVRRLAAGEREAVDAASPRAVMNAYYWKPPFVPAREEALLSSLLTTRVGERFYPGDFTTSGHWPGIAPGRWGPLNALSPKHLRDLPERVLALPEKPPVLWVYGQDDQIVSDASLFEFGTLGQLGAVPGWPGADAYPPQPMVAQMRAFLESYQEAGGRYREVALADCGHSPYLERPQAFGAALHAHLAGE